MCIESNSCKASMSAILVNPNLIQKTYTSYLLLRWFYFPSFYTVAARNTCEHPLPTMKTSSKSPYHIHLLVGSITVGLLSPNRTRPAVPITTPENTSVKTEQPIETDRTGDGSRGSAGFGQTTEFCPPLLASLYIIFFSLLGA